MLNLVGTSGKLHCSIVLLELPNRITHRTMTLGSRLLFGGKPLENHSIPSCYGAIHPTAVFVPLDAILDEKYFALATKEVFGPVQVSGSQSTKVLIACLLCCVFPMKPFLIY